MDLRYGINPQQPARATSVAADAWPVRVIQGQPSYINLLDALNGWQLAREASGALARPAAASFKHVSPAGAAVAGPLDDVTASLHRVQGGRVGDLASAYLRARDADPKSSYGDFIAVSHEVDAELAELLMPLVSDGIIAPGYAPGTVGLLSKKKSGRFLLMEASADFVPPAEETREVFGVRLTQERDRVQLSPALLRDATGEPLTEAATEDLLLGLAVLRYTQSNSVCYVKDGMTLGIGAGQQSRVDCTRLAGSKADTWWLRRHPVVQAMVFRDDVRRQDRINWQLRFIDGDLTPDERLRLDQALAEPAGALTVGDRAEWSRSLCGVSFASDGALPFRDNVDHARRHGVAYIAEPGGSIRSGEVAEACAEHGITLVTTHLRLFHH